MEKNKKNEILEMLRLDLISLINRRRRMISSSANYFNIVSQLSNTIKDTICIIKELELIQESIQEEDDGDSVINNSIVTIDFPLNEYDSYVYIEQELKNYLNIALNSRSFLKSNNHRGIGKTWALIELANDNNFTILCKTLGEAKMYSNRGFYNTEVFSNNIRGKRNKIYVVDESFSTNEIIEMRKYIDIVTGFVRN